MSSKKWRKSARYSETELTRVRYPYLGYFVRFCVPEGPVTLQREKQKLNAPRLSPNQSVIFVMTANPNPDEVSAIFNSECSMSKARTDRPKLADLLEMERGMSWACYE